MNQSAIDRGLFRSLFYRTYSTRNKPPQGMQQLPGYQEAQRPFRSFARPTRESTLRMRHGTYEKIEADGLVAPGTQVGGEDIIIGKIAPRLPAMSEEMGQRTAAHTHRDVSTPLRSTEHGIVDQVMLTTNSDGLKFAKVRVRSRREPQMGDKFASRHGQREPSGSRTARRTCPSPRKE